MTSSSLAKQVKDVSFSHVAKAQFHKFKKDLITLGKQHSLFRVFSDVVEIPVVDEEKSTEEIQATGFFDEEIRQLSLVRNIVSRAIKSGTDDNVLQHCLANCCLEIFVSHTAPLRKVQNYSA